MDLADEFETRPLAVVTGASTGMGLELARGFASANYDLVIAAEDSGIRDVAKSLGDMGANVDGVQVDLSTYAGVEELFSVIEGQGRPIDVLAINAGVGLGRSLAREPDLHAELKLIDLNVTGAVHIAKQVSAQMAKRGRGRILFTSSFNSGLPERFDSVFAGTKGFLTSFAEALRDELRDFGVTVTAVMPGPTETDFFPHALVDDSKKSHVGLSGH